ncbi:MAG: OmpA family protein [Polaromonas sp.]
MISQDADNAQRLKLRLVFGLIALIVASVLALGVYTRGAFAVNAPAPAAVVAGAAVAQPSPAPSRGAQAASDSASIEVEQGVVKFYFASGKADLAAGASDALDDLVKGAKTGRKLVISGFHDTTGHAAQNAGLARRRALAVRSALMAAGVAVHQIEIKKSEQVTGIGSDAGARRVEISLH